MTGWYPWAAPLGSTSGFNLETPMDGYTYMIERNKLMIQRARESEPSDPTASRTADANALLRKRLMDLYSKLEGCGRKAGRDSE